MNYAVGVDCVEVKRFEVWRTFSEKKLLRVFSTVEIAYAKKNDHFFAQRLAVRWAAKEAFLKAASQLFPEQPFSLLAVANSVSVDKDSGGKPILYYDESLVQFKPVESSLSLSHTRCCATAVVVLSKISV